MESIELLVESVGDFYLAPNYVHLYKSTYYHKAHGAWPIKKPFPKSYKQFTYYGHSYMIKPSNIPNACMGLFILLNVQVHTCTEKEPLMPFCGPIYNIMDWRILTSYFFSMAKYDMYGNETSQIKYSEGLYIDSRPKIHRNITGYINSSKGIGNP